MNLSDNPELVNYTGDSFRDLTRIADINEDLWPELFICNKDYLTEEIDSLISQMSVMRECINNEDIPKMKELMIEATQRRKKFGRR